MWGLQPFELVVPVQTMVEQHFKHCKRTYNSGSGDPLLWALYRIGSFIKEVFIPTTNSLKYNKKQQYWYNPIWGFWVYMWFSSANMKLQMWSLDWGQYLEIWYIVICLLNVNIFISISNHMANLLLYYDIIIKFYCKRNIATNTHQF